MKLGLYGGTFDPIHHGHLLLARDAVETLGLDRLLFIPNRLSPHKLDSQPTPPALRAEMIRAAIADEPCFDLEMMELTREAAVSYTIDTVLTLRERYGPEAEFHYLIGHDNLAKLHTWHRIGELRREVNFAVMARESGPSDLPALSRRIDISSTEIRKRVANRASIRYLVPEAVCQLIRQHRLYTS